jgi:hypothetical protein
MNKHKRDNTKNIKEKINKKINSKKEKNKREHNKGKKKHGPILVELKRESIQQIAISHT